MNRYLPTIGITMDDATGAGAEVIVGNRSHAPLHERRRPLVIGNASRLERANDSVRGALRVCRIATASEARYAPGTIDCIDLEPDPGRSAVRPVVGHGR